MTRARVFPVRLREAREQQGLTQSDLADGLGVNLFTVSRWETGKTEPRLRDLVTLAQFLGVTIDWLAGLDVRRRRRVRGR